MASSRKVFACHVPRLRSSISQVWLQGMVVATLPGAVLLLDDGTALVRVEYSLLHDVDPWPKRAGMFLLVAGKVMQDDDAKVGGPVTVSAKKMVELGADPNREVLWWLEVAESWKESTR